MRAARRERRLADKAGRDRGRAGGSALASPASTPVAFPADFPPPPPLPRRRGPSLGIHQTRMRESLSFPCTLSAVIHCRRSPSSLSLSRSRCSFQRPLSPANRPSPQPHPKPLTAQQFSHQASQRDRHNLEALRAPLQPDRRWQRDTPDIHAEHPVSLKLPARIYLYLREYSRSKKSVGVRTVCGQMNFLLCGRSTGTRGVSLVGDICRLDLSKFFQGAELDGTKG